MKSETGTLYVEGKERPKKEADHSRLVGAGLISKGTYSRGLSWVAAREVDLCTCLAEP